MELFEENVLSWLQKYSFDDMFNGPSRQEIRRDPPQQESVTIQIYRGFDANIDQLERVGDSYILSPHKSEQGLIWFSQNIDIANWRGKWLLTYPLEVIKHYERIHYDNGEYYDDVPEEIKAQMNPTENCRFYGNIELPEGWLFSYKVEKHIVCTIPLKITREMLSEN